MTLSLREISKQPSEEDLHLLFELLEERPSYANISHYEMPSWEDHVRHVKTWSRRGWWVIENRLNRQEAPFHDPVGAIYLSERNEIGVSILAARQNKGYATWAILKVVEMFPHLDLLANTAPGNAVSQQLFHGLGFKEIQRTYLLRASE